jgi:ligand-binding sensor domain-containing protein
MSYVINTLSFILLGNVSGCTHTAITSTMKRPSPAVIAPESVKIASQLTPPFARSNTPLEIYSNTTEVEGLAGRSNQLWAATRGGLEQYDVTTKKRVALYTTRDGLPTLYIKSVTLNAKDEPEVVTARHRCVMHSLSQRFVCVGHRPAKETTPTTTFERLEGSPITTRWMSADGTEWVGTAGLGLWARKGGKLQRVTPIAQIVSNHVVAIAEWNSAQFFATFDRGLSRLDNGNFATISVESALLNDIIATPQELFIATSTGIYKSNDGEVFHPETRVTESTISDLAYDAKRRVLYATATNSLWELPLDQPTKKPVSFYLPGGSRSLQAVDVSEDGTVYLASEDRGVIRRDNHGHFSGFDRLSGYPSSWATDVLAVNQETAFFASLRHGVFPIGTHHAPIKGVFEPWTLFLGRDSQDSDALLVGTQNGAWIVRNRSSQKLEELPNPCVHAIARLSSGLWVGTEGGLALYR